VATKWQKYKRAGLQELQNLIFATEDTELTEKTPVKPPFCFHQPEFSPVADKLH
jgi:hypothetical protein